MDSLAANRLAIPRRVDPQAASFDTSVVAALLAGGDSRTRVDDASGTNKYLCPPQPDGAIECFASCTASPIAADGFARVALAFEDIVGAASPRGRAARLGRQRRDLASRLLRYFMATGLAEAILCPSGTDALLTAALLMAAERPGRHMTAILPCAAETGTGVPLAAAGRRFDGPHSGTLVNDSAFTTVEIALRDDAGLPRSESDLNDAYAAAVAAAAGRAVVYLTHGTKTGLVAPTLPPAGADVIVDACQARIAPATVAAYLGRGWPVVVTGSKFFGGPAFSGAVLFPAARRDRRGHWTLPSAGHVCTETPIAPGLDPVALGTALRWTAAMSVMDAFAPRAEAMAQLLRGAADMISEGLATLPDIEPVAGRPPRGAGWADLPSIFTFAIRDPDDRSRKLTMGELRPLYQRLARQGVLLGQPVDLGGFGGLRIAIGARDMVEDADESRFATLFGALGAALTVPRAQW